MSESAHRPLAKGLLRVSLMTVILGFEEEKEKRMCERF